MKKLLFLIAAISFFSGLYGQNKITLTGQSTGGGGGMSNPMTTLGDVIYGGSSGTATRLAGNTTVTRKFFRQTGDGTNSAAPAWDVLVAGDLPAHNHTATEIASGNLPLARLYQSPQTLTDAATVSWDMASNANAKVTLGGNRALAVSNAVAGITYTLEIIQDGTGSRTLSLPAGWKGYNGQGTTLTLTTTASAVDILTVYYNGTTYYWSSARNFN